MSPDSVANPALQATSPRCQVLAPCFLVLFSTLVLLCRALGLIVRCRRSGMVTSQAVSVLLRSGEASFFFRETDELQLLCSLVRLLAADDDTAPSLGGMALCVPRP